MSNNSKSSSYLPLLRLFQGALIGLGAVLPGISGGVMCVVFGVYKPIIEFLSNPIKAFREYCKTLLPLIIGGGAGFVVVSKLLSFVLTKYPDPSVCVFVGLIIGMLPSLFREAGQKGRNKGSAISFFVCFAIVFSLLTALNLIHANIRPNLLWYIFSGFCIALSVIAPGMSFSTLLMPLGIYTPLVEGIGNFNFSVILPAGIGAVVTVILLAKAVSKLLDTHYSVAFHGIIGIVTAATLVIIPFKSFTDGILPFMINLTCILSGIVLALILDKVNQKIEVPER